MGTEGYYRLSDIAKMFGVSQSAVSRWYSISTFPQPDIWIGNIPYWSRKRDMHQEVYEWRRSRPGRGARTDLWKRQNR